MNWKDYFMGIAEAVALKSKDPSSKVGCVIVDRGNRPVSFGFNGFVAKCDETKMTQERPMKYHQVIHSEMNAIIFARRDLTGCSAYITDAPCDNCLKHLLQAGVRKITYKSAHIMKDRGTEDQKKAIVSLILATEADVYNVNGDSYLKELL